MRIVIVGAGHAGTTLATALRQRGHDSEIVLLSAEAEVPYHRPPLSKQLLQRDTPQFLQARAAFDEHDVGLRLDARVTSLDLEARSVVLDDARTVTYDVLVLATGSVANTLPIPGAELDGVHVLRSFADSRALAADLAEGGPLAVLGGGWIGLEAAASARQAGIEVTVFEREQRLLPRVAGAMLADYLLDLHRSHGVEVLTGVTVDSLLADERGRVRGVRLADGAERAAGAVLIGVGGRPNVDLALDAGLKVDDGIVVDPVGRTSDPDVYAIGDVARADGGRRLESIPSALEQARRTAAAIIGEPVPDPELPWFWSDQYDARIQIACVRPDDADVVLRGAPADHAFSVLHVVEGRTLAAEVVSRPADFVALRRIIEAGDRYDAASLADTSHGLAELTPLDQSEGDPDPGDPHVVFELADGTEVRVDLSEGQSVMEAALQAEVPGIIAECGGLCTCGTCHVHVEPEWMDRLEPADDYETETLEMVDDHCPRSRLSCQLVMTCDLAGLRVKVPDSRG